MEIAYAMSLLRIIARLDIKGPNVVKGIHMEGLRVIGKPEELANAYAEAGADELLYIDTVASLYGRNQLAALLSRTVEDVFIPITVGGGVKSRADVKRLLDAGADKVAINTAAIRDPALIRECADHYGAQAVVVSIEAKRQPLGGWECYTDNGREKTGKDVLLWAEEAISLGAGEILLTSIDQEGTRQRLRSGSYSRRWSLIALCLSLSAAAWVLCLMACRLSRLVLTRLRALRSFTTGS
jgi:cyclase